MRLAFQLVFPLAYTSPYKLITETNQFLNLHLKITFTKKFI